MTSEDRKIEEQATGNLIKAVITAALILFGANILYHYHQRGDTIQRLQDKILQDSIANHTAQLLKSDI